MYNLLSMKNVIILPFFIYILFISFPVPMVPQIGAEKKFNDRMHFTTAEAARQIIADGRLKACWKHQSYAVWLCEGVYQMCHYPWTRFATTQAQWYWAKDNGRRHVLMDKYESDEREGALIHGFIFSVDHPIYHTLKNAGWMGPAGRRSHMCKSDEVDILIAGCVHTVHEYNRGNNNFTFISSEQL